MNGLRVAVFLAARQLGARWRLNATAVAGVALGVLVLIAMTGVMRGFQEEFLSQILRVAAHARVLAEEPESAGSVWERGSGGPAAVEVSHARPTGREVRIAAPLDLVERLEAHPDVTAACPGIEGRALLAAGSVDTGAVILGVDPTRQDACTPLSRYVVAGDWSTLTTGRAYCALGVGLAETLDVRVGDRIRAVSPSGEPETFVVAVLVDTDVPALDDTRIYASLGAAQTVLGRPDIVGHIDVRLRDPLDVDRAVASIAGLVDYRVEGWREANENLLSLFRLQNAIVNLVIVAILLVGGFGILAIQAMLVLQKQRDIAILRAIGLRRGDIVVCFLAQGLVIAVAGAVLGDLGGALMLDFLRTLPIATGGDIIQRGGFLVYEDPRLYVWSLGFGSVLGTLAGLFPAITAARVEPVVVLRGQVA